MKKAFFFFLIVSTLLNFNAISQEIIPNSEMEISILTIGPGQNLYDKFGHSAFRIKDPNRGTDYVYNYGTYDFNTPNFYTKFAQGKLLYSLTVAYFEDFYNSYVAQNRWVKEQTLDLNPTEKVKLQTYLNNNAQIENRDYKYDFFYDNCATRIRDVLVTVFPEKLTYPATYIEENKTFRKLIQQNVKANSWGSLGMDVAIGAVTDVEASAWEHQFLPNYVFQAAANATLEKNGTKQPLVKETSTLFKSHPIKEEHNFIISPLFIFSLLSLLILAVTTSDYFKKTRSRFLDVAIFLITGVIGVMLLLLWFATDHSATANNYNILWAFPVSLCIVFAIAKRQPKKWVRRYIVFLLLLMCLLTLHSITGVQGFAIGLIPLFFALVIRYLYLIYYLKSQRKIS